MKVIAKRRTVTITLSGIELHIDEDEWKALQQLCGAINNNRADSHPQGSISPAHLPSWEALQQFNFVRGASAILD